MGLLSWLIKSKSRSGQSLALRRLTRRCLVSTLFSRVDGVAVVAVPTATAATSAGIAATPAATSVATSSATAATSATNAAHPRDAKANTLRRCGSGARG